MEKMAKDRLPGLKRYGQTKSKQSEYLEKVLLDASQTGDSHKLYNVLERVDLNKVNFDVKERDTECTPLMVAAENGHEQVVSILLSVGSDVTLRNIAGHTVLDVAPPKIKPLVLDAVNRKGAGQPLLWQAAWQGNATVVKKLLNLNPKLNINSKNSEGLTPLLLVTRDLDLFNRIQQEVVSENYNPTEVVAELLHKNADCTIVDNEGQNALHYTARHSGTNAKNIISLLARKDSLNVDVRDNQSYSALHFASETGDLHILLALIDNGADVNAKGHLGRTPLHITASRGDEKTSGLLLDHGANVLLVDDLGFTPVDVAKGNNVQVLLKEAWTANVHRSMDTPRVKSAPNALSMVKLKHLEIQDVTNNDEQERLLSKRTSKKSLKKLQTRSHSEEQTKPLHSSQLPRRSRSQSSGPTSCSTLDPVRDLSSSQLGHMSPEAPKSSPGYSKDFPPNPKIHQTALRERSRPSEVVPRTTAKVSVLNIDLIGSRFEKHKSKSCSELPFSRYRMHKLSTRRATSDIPEQPLDDALNLRGRSLSVVSLSSFEALPGITPVPPENKGSCNDPSDNIPVPNPEIAINPPADGLPADSTTDDDQPNKNFLNQTFNSKDKPVFWFPLVKDSVKTNDTDNGTNTAFFVDFNNLEVPAPKCSKCGVSTKSAESKPPRGTLCFSCHRKSVGKNCFWVSMDGNDSERKTTEDSKDFDDRTISIDKTILGCTGEEKAHEKDSVSKSDRDSRKMKDSDERKLLESRPEELRILNKMDDTIPVLGNNLKSLRTYGPDERGRLEGNEGQQELFEECIGRKGYEVHQGQLGYEQQHGEQGGNKHREKQVEEVQEHEGYEGQREVKGYGRQREQEGYERQREQEGYEEHHRYGGQSGELRREERREQQGSYTSISEQSSRMQSGINRYDHEDNVAFEMKPSFEDPSEIKHCTGEERVKNLEMSEIYGGLEDKTKMNQRAVSSSERLGINDAAAVVGECRENFPGLSKNVGYKTKSIPAHSSCMSNDGPGDRTLVSLGHGNHVEQRRDGEEQTGATSFAPKPPDASPGRTSGITPHEVVIVNAFPTPEPPKAPLVNVTSNCQCDRFVKDVGNNVKKKKKGKGKKSGTSDQRTVTKGRKGSGKMAGNSKSEEEIKKRFGKVKRKKKGKSVGSAIVKEISVLQPNLMRDSSDTASEQKTAGIDELCPAEIVQGPGTAQTHAQSLPVSQPSAGEGELCAASRIPDVSRLRGADDESVVAGTTTNMDVSCDKEFTNDQSSLVPSLREGAPTQLDTTTSASSEKSKVTSADGICVASGNEEERKIQISALVGMCENDSDDFLSSDESEFFGTVSELDDELEDIIQEILEETEEMDRNFGKVGKNANDSTKTRVDTDRHAHVKNNSTKSGTQAGTEHAIRSTTPEIANTYKGTPTGSHTLTRANVDSDSRRTASTSKESLRRYSETSFRNVSSWLLGNRRHSSPTRTPRDILPPSDRRVDTTNTKTTDSSHDLSPSTPRAMMADVSSDYSTLSDDTWEESDRGKYANSEGLGPIPHTSSSKPSIDQQNDHWSTSSASIPIAENNFSSGSDPLAIGDRSNCEQLLDGQFAGGGDLVHSRLSGHKSGRFTTRSSDTTSSEEEEIVWKKGNMLGKGAFGKVWCGLTNAGQMIAVKQVGLITSNMEVAEKQYEKLQEEVGLLKSLKHQNIVSFLGTCLDGGVVNIFMEFVPGGSIASVLARFGPLYESVFQYYTKQIVVGVDYLHRNNVVHRDIKGGNIMLMPTGVIKLIDFGCAKRLYMNISHSQKDILRSMKGTPYWMAPEVIAETGYGLKSDIWSIGSTVFEMATGKPPWSHLPPMSAIFAIGQGSDPPKLGEPNSENARDFVACCMIRHPDARWSAEQLLRHPFIKNCDGQR